ncbi:MAG: S41 family peptidase [Bacteroidales bacterium]|nr:S41 family peptidase [Bacteroidales bacterium]
MKKVIVSVLTVLISISLTAQDFILSARKLQSALYIFSEMYVDSIDSDKLAEEAVRAMVKQLDPHTEYMTREEMKEMNEPLQGGFDGIGISFNMMKDTLFIVEVISGGPSEKVGLLAGDRIIKVDGENIAGVKMSNKEVMKRLKGPKGTKVTVSVQRRGQASLMDFRITRDKIPLYSLDASYMVDRQTGYIKISRFGATTMDEYHKAFADLQKQGMKQLILDLQSNGGGYMNTAIDLSDEFLGKGKCIVYTEGLHSPRQQADATEKGSFERGNLVVLIDEYSASSSEIVTGAIQDWDRGLVIGRRSFGKGLVQRVIPMGDGTALKVTVSRYHTPSGRCIQKPYEDGKEAYGKDLIDRYNRGEMLSADSIHFPDSLKYETLLKGRTVYGGGGIMPDVFIPYDTTRFTQLHRQLISKGILNQFTLRYTDDHRQMLKEQYKTEDDFIRSFSVSDEVLEELFRLARQENLDLSQEQLSSDMTVLKLQLKAYIARDLYATAAYYKVMSSENEALQEALRILSDKKLRKRYGLE